MIIVYLIVVVAVAVLAYRQLDSNGDLDRFRETLRPETIAAKLDGWNERMKAEIERRDWWWR